MINLPGAGDCCGCAACASVCPKNCIAMLPDAEGFLQPSIALENCIGCHLCEKTCPVLSPIEAEGTPNAYAAVNLDETIRIVASSGGIFYLLAKEVIALGGVVFGAKMNEQLKVVHDFSETLTGVSAFMGSKYVQSEIRDAYRNAKEFLLQGRPVLFTGTPCQIQGLKKYLGKDYGGLVCLDLICHGVPSPLVWEKYIEYSEQKYHKKIKHVRFRDKGKYSHKTTYIKLEFTDGKVKYIPYYEDIFIKGFLADLTLRPTCSHCFFKGISRCADITLADFWGVETVVPEMADKKGVSLVLLHSKKAKDIFEQIQKHMKVKPVSVKDAVAENAMIIKSAKNAKRDVFMREIQTASFSAMYEKYLKDPLSVRIRNKIKRIAKIILKRA